MNFQNGGVRTSVSLLSHKNQFELAEERISECEYRPTEIIKFEVQTEKRMNRK